LQSAGAKTDWKREEEFRHKGDFPLSSIERRFLACFCKRREEADRIEKEFGIKTYGFEN
jgi:hypothetical protein